MSVFSVSYNSTYMKHWEGTQIKTKSWQKDSDNDNGDDDNDDDDDNGQNRICSHHSLSLLPIVFQYCYKNISLWWLLWWQF
jgi:hypothetical protein